MNIYKYINDNRYRVKIEYSKCCVKQQRNSIYKTNTDSTIIFLALKKYAKIILIYLIFSVLINFNDFKLISHMIKQYNN